MTEDGYQTPPPANLKVWRVGEIASIDRGWILGAGAVAVAVAVGRRNSLD